MGKSEMKISELVEALFLQHPHPHGEIAETIKVYPQQSQEYLHE